MELFTRSYDVPKYELEALWLEKSAEQVINELMCEDGKYKAVYNEDPNIKTTMLQRINLLWVWPLFLIAAPFSYIIRGKVGVNYYTPAGRLLKRLIGNY